MQRANRQSTYYFIDNLSCRPKLFYCTYPMFLKQFQKYRLSVSTVEEGSAITILYIVHRYLIHKYLLKKKIPREAIHISPPAPTVKPPVSHTGYVLRKTIVRGTYYLFPIFKMEYTSPLIKAVFFSGLAPVLFYYHF